MNATMPPPERLGLACVLAGSLLFATVPTHAAVPASAAPPELDWRTSPLDLDLRGMNGERYTFHCPPGKPQPSRVVGSGPYTDASSICAAAVHAGALGARDGGEVTIEIRPGERRYAGSQRHYLRSSDEDAGWSGSFVVIGGDATPSKP
ncbi:MAG: hypothetical protein KF903_11220 [Dokdonella sp.]|uniref:LCCL domain-containing protein n=1 Tax=Dokdonella sp. TaxID=2291710 RepID=UPI0025C4862C|nr:LCCL domain-containing protein [Dokdonella sp.]MBX3701550.1 hypothetical protein [Dokdonella sp.]